MVYAVVVAVILIIAGFAITLLLINKKLNETLASALTKSTDQLISLANQKLGAEKAEIKTELDNKKQMIEKIVEDLRKNVEDHNKKLLDSDKDRISSFSSLKQQLETQTKITEQLFSTTEGLRKVLSNNQLRGQFGEQVAEDLLKMTGFVRGVDYDFNTALNASANRPDFTIYLPDKVRVNVDVKFPYANLQKMTETDDKETKKTYLRLFERDIREKIKQVTTRDYINPDDNTVDFVVMFIPNEMIFSFIYENMPEVWNEAMTQKVVMAGPFNFTAVLRLIRQSYSNFKYQNNVRGIIKEIKNFETEFKKYNESFERVGKRIESLVAEYEEADSTRKKQLFKVVDRIRLEEAEKSIPLNILEPQNPSED